MDITKKEFEKIITESKSKSEICKKLKFNTNGAGYEKLKTIANLYDINLDCFGKSKNHFIKYEIIIKKCPVCGNEFETKKGSKDEKDTCSHACANTFFRSGKNNPNYIDIDDYDIKSCNFSKKYRKVCFENHEHKCVVCEEKFLLDVHHFDGNKKNNKPENLIPLCATHHNYWHSKFRYLIEEKVVNYVNEFKRDVD